MKKTTMFQLAWPLFLNMLLAIGVSFADSLMISNYSNDAAAAVSVANQVLAVAYDVALLLAVGAAIYLAQMIGGGKLEEARTLAVNALTGSTLFGAAIAVVLIACSPLLLRLVQTPSEIWGDTMVYLGVTSVSLIANGIVIGGAYVLRSFGKTKDILLLGALANVLYMLLSYMLIFGAFGAPELGVLGSALASLLVRCIGAGLLAFVVWKRLSLTFRFRLRQIVRDSWHMARAAFPSIGDNLAYNLYQLTILGMISAIGVASILSRSYALTISSFASLFLLTLSQANETLVGYAQGKGNTKLAYKRAMRSGLLAAAVCTGVAALIACFSAPVIAMFTDREDVQRLTSVLLWINVAIQPFQAANAILFHSLKAVGDTVRPALWSVGVTWLIAVPVGYVGIQYFGQGLAFLWGVFIVEEGVKLLWMWLRWRGRRWSERRLATAGSATGSAAGSVA